MKILYITNYPDTHKELFDLEMKSIFGFTPENKYFTTTHYINPSRSAFIKGCLKVLYTGNSLEELESNVLKGQLYFDGYKIRYLKMDKDVKYEHRLKAMRVIGFAIEGDYALHEPNVELAITKLDGEWLFGYYIKNDNEWTLRKQKPYNYSYALEVKLARAILNIAIQNDFNLSLVDPCCGIGTVVIEGRAMGLDIKGYDINPIVVEHSNENLAYFGYQNDIENISIQNITDKYNVAIVDLPYGRFSKTNTEEQTSIIENSRKISDKTIIISMTDMSELIKSCGFKITDKCKVGKSNSFSRYITICTK